MPPDYPWYRVVEGDGLEQGDLLPNCVAPVQPEIDPGVSEPEGDSLEGVRHDTVVVVTQSCDLAQDKDLLALVCPAWGIMEFLNTAQGSRRDVKSKLEKGRFARYHLLNECDLQGHKRPHLVVDFGSAFSVPVAYLTELTHGKRLRLLPPYRERLAQELGRYYMRVGLPLDMAPIA